ncbi:MAG TPA: CxxC-x17-CxxC domain-containing protein [Candidatus Paceibacterota bacterium]|jgi:CxxC-x17-CxxC domain-containing protein|nr:CxxC-x17-CxxC domain-containing protein [Candidatus Paceibacterota bacterium]
MKEFKKGPRKGSYNPAGFKKGPRTGFKGTPKRESRPLEMHQATCVRCKKFCEVPFKPNGKKPVYCRDCFALQDAEPSARAHTSPRASYSERTIVHTSVVPRTPDVAAQIKVLNDKIDALTRMVASLSNKTAQ